MHDNIFKQNTSTHRETGGHMPSLLQLLPILRGKLQKRTHFSHLSCTGKCRLHGKQPGQTAQIDGQHGQREDVGHLAWPRNLVCRTVAPCCLASPNKVSIILRITWLTA